MTMCTNKNIINYYCAYYYRSCLFMFIEYMDGGALTDIIYQYMKNSIKCNCIYFEINSIGTITFT
jgi:serine/threonine protein kinase